MSKKIYLFSTTSHEDAISINSLDITFFKQDIDFSVYDYLIITSKQAVNTLKQYNKDDYIDKKALCVSDASAKHYRSLGGTILESSFGYGDDLKDIIKKYPQDTRWLYIHAKVTASDFSKELIKDGFNIQSVVGYESVCSKEILDFRDPGNSVLIFTSPSSVECYLKNNTIKKDNIVIVIGKTTAKALPTGIKYKVSELRSIDSCIELAKRYSQ